MQVWTNPLTVGGLAVAGVASAGAAIGVARSHDTGIPAADTVLNMGTIASVGVMVAGVGVGTFAVKRSQQLAGTFAFWGGGIAALAMGAAMLSRD